MAIDLVVAVMLVVAKSWGGGGRLPSKAPGPRRASPDSACSQVTCLAHTAESRSPGGAATTWRKATRTTAERPLLPGPWNRERVQLKNIEEGEFRGPGSAGRDEGHECRQLEVLKTDSTHTSRLKTSYQPIQVNRGPDRLPQPIKLRITPRHVWQTQTQSEHKDSATSVGSCSMKCPSFLPDNSRINPLKQQP